VNERRIVVMVGSTVRSAEIFAESSMMLASAIGRRA